MRACIIAKVRTAHAHVHIPRSERAHIATSSHADDVQNNNVVCAVAVLCVRLQCRACGCIVVRAAAVLLIMGVGCEVRNC